MKRKTPTTRIADRGIPRAGPPFDPSANSGSSRVESRDDKPRGASRRGPGGFTLVELLVVIGIIVLLAGILIPSVSLAFRLADEARAKSRLAELANGCEAYYHDYNYYPGQAYPTMLGTNTGSQVLAACLFRDLDIIDPDDTANPKRPLYITHPDDPRCFPVSKYAPLKTDDLISAGTPTLKANSISDQTSEPMAILYYPARLGQAPQNQFVEGDNSAYGTGTWYTYGDTGGGTPFQKYIKDRRFDGDISTRPYGQDKFIMITAGLDRVYGAGKNDSGNQDSNCPSDDSHYPSW